MTTRASAASSRSRTVDAAHSPAMPEVERVVVRDHVRPSPVGDDRDLEQLGEPGQLGRRPGPQDAGSGQDHRPSRRRQQLDDRPDRLVGRARRRRAGALEPGVVGDQLVEQVLGKGEEGRSGPAADGLPDGL